MSDISPEVEKLRKNTVNLLSSVLTAKAKVGIPLHLLAYEYEETVFEKLKWKEMGYGTLKQFIIDQNNVFTLNHGSDGHFHVKAIPTEETKHIHRLVTGQKKKTKSKKKKAQVVFSVKRFAGPHVSRPPPFARGGGRPSSMFTFNNTNRNNQPSGSSRTFFSKNPSMVKPTTHTNNSVYNKNNKTSASLPPRFQRALNNNSNSFNSNNNSFNNNRPQPQKPASNFPPERPSPNLRNTQPSASSPITTTASLNGKNTSFLCFVS